MNTKSVLFALLLIGFSTVGLRADEADGLFKDSWKEYQDRNYGEAIGTLRALIKLLEDKTAERAESAIPERIEQWSGGDLKRENLALLGGGVAVHRTYRSGAKEITVKLVKDSPVGDEVMKILMDDDLVSASGKRVYMIHGEKAIVEGARKLMMVVAGEIYLEIAGDNDTRTADLVSFTRKLDLRSLKKLK